MSIPDEPIGTIEKPFRCKFSFEAKLSSLRSILTEFM